MNERLKMNMLDMHTREKANKIHLDQMYREAKDRRLLRSSNQLRDPGNAHPKRGQRFAIALAALFFSLGFLLIVTILN